MRTSKKVALTREEKHEVRGALVSYMQDHPVRNAAPGRQVEVKRDTLSRYLLTLRPMPIALILVLMVGVGTSAAAETALPGDALYSVKTEINEPVRAALSVSVQAQAHWEERRAERRLEEAAALEARGRLDAQTRAQLEARFEEHAQRTEDRIELLRTVSGGDEKAAQLAARLEASLHAHEAVLSHIAQDKDKDRNELRPLLNRVENRADKAQRLREKIETSIEVRSESTTSTPEQKEHVEAAARARMDATAHQIEQVRKFMDNKRDDVDASVMARAQVKFDNARNVYATGKAHFEAKQYGRAFVDFQEAFRLLNNIRIFINLEHASEQRKDREGDDASSTTTVKTDVRVDSKVRVHEDTLRVHVKSDGRLQLGR